MMKMNKLSKKTKSNYITYAMVLIIFVVIQAMISTDSISSLLKGMLVPLCIYVILAVSLNLTVGILGELSLGHAGFMCIGAFSSAIFSLSTIDSITSNGLRFTLAIVVGALTAALFGFLIGIPVLRLRGDYLAIVTLAFGEIIKNFMNVVYLGIDNNGFHISLKDSMSLNMGEEGRMLIKGAQGITGTPKSSTFIIGVLMIMLTLVVVLNLINSRTGRAIMAIRDNRIAAESVGLNITKYKLLAFTISAAFAGVAGALYSHNFSSLTATTNKFGYNMSIMILVFVVLGGIGNIRGSIIAAILLTLLPELLRGLNDYRMLIYSIVLITVMIFNSSQRASDFRKKYSPKAFLRSKFSKKEAA